MEREKETASRVSLVLEPVLAESELAQERVQGRAQEREREQAEPELAQELVQAESERAGRLRQSLERSNRPQGQR